MTTPVAMPDLDAAVEIAPRIWWVGAMIPGDQFQCHVYLIEQGDQSVVIDPGSALVADEVIRKIDSVIGLDHVRWLVCSHSDPDIIGALPAFTAHGLHPDATIITHWRDEALLRHCGTPLPFWRVDEHDWRLALEDRTLRFVFTPYAHFAGAFCTFDVTSGTLFSSDLFGGFSDDRSLVATSLDVFEGMRDFHEHYMPSQEILEHALRRLRELPIDQVAPQHGHIIPKDLVEPIMDRLSQLQCGIYLLARDDPGLDFLLQSNRAIRAVVDTLVAEASFPVIAERLAGIASSFLGSTSLAFWARSGSTVLLFDGDDKYQGQVTDPPPLVQEAFAGATIVSGSELVVPLRVSLSAAVVGVADLGFVDPPTLDGPTTAILNQIAELVEVSLEREVMRRAADLERDTFYEQATHDPLTGLFNRAYVAEAAERLLAVDDRTDHGLLAALMVDIDHFKRVNDSVGHPAGDLVLRHVADAIAGAVRPGDIAVRYGGEEFLVLLSNVDEETSLTVAERIRSSIAAPSTAPAAVTASVGIALRSADETFEALVARADVALYSAKQGGRNRVDLAA